MCLCLFKSFNVAHNAAMHISLNGVHTAPLLFPAISSPLNTASSETELMLHCTLIRNLQSGYQKTWEKHLVFVPNQSQLFEYILKKETSVAARAAAASQVELNRWLAVEPPLPVGGLTGLEFAEAQRHLYFSFPGVRVCVCWKSAGAVILGSCQATPSLGIKK